jgi:hypothetical protein
VIVAGEGERAVFVVHIAVWICNAGPGVQLAAVCFVLANGALPLEIVCIQEEAVAMNVAERVKGAVENSSHLNSRENNGVALPTIRARKKERAAYGLVA